MKVEQDFKVEKVEDNIVVTQTVVRTMDAKEAMKDLMGLESQINQQAQQTEQLKKQIEDNKFQKDLNVALETQTKLVTFKTEWEQVIAEDKKAIVDGLLAEVRALKVERGYARVNDTNQKMVMRNQIMAEVVTKHDIDLQHPIARELSASFGK